MSAVKLLLPTGPHKPIPKCNYLICPELYAALMAEPAETNDTLRTHVATVGIVDDDESVRLALASWLRSIGISSETFASGSDLLCSSSLNHMSCVIIDQQMRGMSGLEVVRALKESGSLIPIIMVSAHADAEIHRRAAAAGVYAFVNKPFTDLSLMEIVHDALVSGTQIRNREPE